LLLVGWDSASFDSCIFSSLTDGLASLSTVGSFSSLEVRVLSPVVARTASLFAVVSSVFVDWAVSSFVASVSSVLTA
jgi:hypothetical protein